MKRFIESSQKPCIIYMKSFCEVTSLAGDVAES